MKLRDAVIRNIVPPQLRETIEEAVSRDISRGRERPIDWRDVLDLTTRYAPGTTAILGGDRAPRASGRGRQFPARPSAPRVAAAIAEPRPQPKRDDTSGSLPACVICGSAHLVRMCTVPSTKEERDVLLGPDSAERQRLLAIKQKALSFSRPSATTAKASRAADSRPRPPHTRTTNTQPVHVGHNHARRRDAGVNVIRFDWADDVTDDAAGDSALAFANTALPLQPEDDDDTARFAVFVRDADPESDDEGPPPLSAPNAPTVAIATAPGSLVPAAVPPALFASAPSSASAGPPSARTSSSPTSATAARS